MIRQILFQIRQNIEQIVAESEKSTKCCIYNIT